MLRFRVFKAGQVTLEANCSTFSLPLCIPNLRGEVCLQDCVEQCAVGERGLQALTTVPDIVGCHLGRYVLTPEGISKNVRAISLAESQVRVPHFLGRDASFMQTDTIPYHIRAVIIHRGPTLNSGHYQAILRVGDLWIWTDDSS